MRRETDRGGPCRDLGANVRSLVSFSGKVLENFETRSW